MPNSTAADSKRFKLHYLYYFLAGFDLLTIGISLFLSNQILGIYSASVDDHHRWSSWQATTSQLSELAANVNAPGNDVFISGKPDQERLRLDQVWNEYQSLATVMKQDIQVLPESQSEDLVQHLDDADLALIKTRNEAHKIFAHIRKGETEEAGQAMSRMDQNFAEGLGSLLQLSRAMSDQQLESLEEESHRAADLAKYERGIMALVVCMVSLALYYGHVLSTRATKDEEKRNDMQLALIEASRKAGMADVASGVLHNVGNVLNSVNVSTASLHEKVQNSRTARINDVLELFERNKGDLATFVTSKQGEDLLAYLKSLSVELQNEKVTLTEEISTLCSSVEHIKRIVQMQQSVASTGGICEPFDVVSVIEDSLKINQASLERHDVVVDRVFLSSPQTIGDRHKAIQILVNLISNAKHAVCRYPDAEKRITIRINSTDEIISIEVEDQGMGIAPEDQTRIFNHGFTTKGDDGHGFGLHSSALAATELNGTLTACSAGLGKGACFTLQLPALNVEPHNSEQKLVHNGDS